MKTVRIGSLLLSLLLLLAACTVEIGSRVPDPSTSTSSTAHSPTTTLPTRDLEVRVLDAETRATVPGIHVQLSDPAGADVGVEVTDAEGVARWFDIPVESVSLSASTRCEAASECEVYMTLGSVAVDLPNGVTSTDLEVVPFSHNLPTAGVIRGNEVWASQIHLTGSVVVPTGALLVIEPGTTGTVASLDDGSADDVRGELDKPDGIVVWSEGLVVAAGTPEAPVRFRAADETESWGGLIGTFDARHVGIEESCLVRVGAGSTMSYSSISSGQLWSGAGAEDAGDLY